MQDTAKNLRYHLWRRKIAREDWPDQLSEIAGCDRRRAKQLLRYGQTSAEEQDRIAQAFQIGEEELRYGDFADSESSKTTVRENLKCLLAGLEHGEKKKLASRLGVDQTTISRWASGQRVPSREKLDALSEYLALPSGTDLRRSPLFLSLQPPTADACRDWLYKRLDGLDPARLRELFPALERLLEDDD